MKIAGRGGTPEEKKRAFELATALMTTALLLMVSKLESRLFSVSESLSENREFFTTLAYFALINLNVILILVLSFLIFRNVTRLIVDRRRRVPGSGLKTRLVYALVFFALAPTVLLFYVSTKFITTSFEAWFSEKVQSTMQKTREAGSLIYKQDQKRLQSLARIALQRISVERLSEDNGQMVIRINPGKLTGFDLEYGLSAVKVYNQAGGQIWHSLKGWDSDAPEVIDVFVEKAIGVFRNNQDIRELSTVVGEDSQDVVKGIAPLRNPYTGDFLGTVLAEVRFETQILKSIEKIIDDFGDLKPGVQLIRLSYMILMVVITLLIVFSATWMGFYVARGITGPLQNLANATREVALGNYDISLKVKGDDETGQLVQAFNLMTQDLQAHQKQTLEAQRNLQLFNEELERRRQYMEIVLKHITAGVISLSSDYRITSVNAAAEKLLRVSSVQLTGQPVLTALPSALYQAFWLPIFEGLKKRSAFHGQLDLLNNGYDVALMVNATRIYDEKNVEIGYVLVFDDAREQVRAQRVAAWREVARRIAHEIKNPITPIKLNAQRLLRRFRDKFKDEEHEVFRGCLETIISQVDSLRDLVNEFSKFSRLPGIRPVPSDINEVLTDVARVFQVSYPELRIDTSGLRPIPKFPLDKEQLGRAVTNLFTNAVAAFVEERRGEIRLCSWYMRDLSTVRVEISDNGRGIPKEFQDRVLEPYYSTRDEGTGLGLAIVNQIISDHGGYLRIRENEPFGTIVSIELPAGSPENRSG
ncbi:MAG: HAMP domain-containing protein [Deltaproteobacteria bacterium]|nr:HAMP domain-containing protein [Deltaproteobacteria bacterium]